MSSLRGVREMEETLHWVAGPESSSFGRGDLGFAKIVIYVK